MGSHFEALEIFVILHQARQKTVSSFFFKWRSKKCCYYVEGYFRSFEVGKKDNPESYRKIASQLGVDITNSVYVDDQAKYVKTAKKAGFRKVYRRASPEQPEGQNEEHDGGYETINSLSEVVENKVPVQVSDEASHMHASHEAQAENQLSEDAGAEGEGDKVETAVEAE